MTRLQYDRISISVLRFGHLGEILSRAGSNLDTGKIDFDHQHFLIFKQRLWLNGLAC